MTQHPTWQLQGSYFETCNCEAACPCVWLEPPTDGDCKLLVAWHIETGYCDRQRLDNLNVALACYVPGHMKDGNWQASLYLDQRAGAEQGEALTRIFSGQLAGHLAILMSFVSEVISIRLLGRPV